MSEEERCYIVSFETNSQETREQVLKELKSYGAYCPINKHCWAIITGKTAVEIRDHLKTKLAPEERLFVIRSGAEAAWLNAFGKDNTKWLKKNL